MKSFVTSLAALLIVSVTVAPAAAQTADEIIEKSVAAMGGRAAFAKLHTRVTTGTITLQTPAGDVAGTLEIFNVAPNKARTVIKADLTALGAGSLVLDQRFDGTNGYVLDSLQGNRDMAGDQLDTMRYGSFPHPFLDYKQRGIAAKLQGKESISGRDAYVLILEPPSGPAARQYIDAETFLVVKTAVNLDVPQLGRQIEQVSNITDYRVVDGVKLPFAISVSSAVQNYTVVVQKVEHNGAIDESMFAKPH